MQETPAIADPCVRAAAPAGPSWRQRLREWARPSDELARARRARRVGLLLMGAWIINAFDLTFTLMAVNHQHFMELNPIAAPLVHNTAALIAYKVVIAGIGSIILLRFRTHVLTEIGCWGVCAIYSALAGIWWKYYFAAP